MQGVFVTFFDPSGEDRDQCDAEKTTGEEIIEEIGNHECVAVQVAFRTDSEQRRQQSLPSQAEQPGEENRSGDDESGAAETEGALQGRRASSRRSGTARSPRPTPSSMPGLKAPW